LPFEQVERRGQTATHLNLGQCLQPGHHGLLWSAQELALLGTLPDEAASGLIGRPTNPVRIKRTRLRMPNARDRRKKGCKS
jgi:hypothetical protein